MCPQIPAIVRSTCSVLLNYDRHQSFLPQSASKVAKVLPGISMKTRIQVPLPLPEPDFEDEATVVSARQVVPLDEAQTQDRRRKVRAILPLLLAATLCGALGAVAVNYLAQRPSAPTISQPATTGARLESQPAALEPSPPDEGVTTQADSQVEVADNSQSSGSLPAGDSSTGEAPESTQLKPAVTAAKKPSTSSDPKQLVRPRRVHPPQAGQNDQPKARGAAKIQDIFSGPNP